MQNMANEYCQNIPNENKQCQELLIQNIFMA